LRSLQDGKELWIDAQQHAFGIVLIGGDNRCNHLPVVRKQQRLSAARLNVRRHAATSESSMAFIDRFAPFRFSADYAA
jgi:hypothetical protein